MGNVEEFILPVAARVTADANFWMRIVVKSSARDVSLWLGIPCKQEPTYGLTSCIKELQPKTSPTCKETECPTVFGVSKRKRSHKSLATVSHSEHNPMAETPRLDIHKSAEPWQLHRNAIVPGRSQSTHTNSYVPCMYHTRAMPTIEIPPAPRNAYDDMWWPCQTFRALPFCRGVEAIMRPDV